MGMGDLDEAIREHLELKRKHGASDEEITLKEEEAQRQGALPPEPGAQFAPEAPESPPAEPPQVDVAEVAEVAAPTPRPAAPPPDQLEPDEVLPEEALELEVPPAEEPEDTAGPAPDWSSSDPPDGPEEAGEDLLEETPEFLEDMPEQDRLWFEQRPPKDFDFGD
jgi:hypothetical protein